jgi:hypothetical protein
MRRGGCFRRRYGRANELRRFTEVRRHKTAAHRKVRRSTTTHKTFAAQVPGTRLQIATTPHDIVELLFLNCAGITETPA